MTDSLYVTASAWAVTVGLVIVLFAVDLLVAAARPHEVGFPEADAWSLF